MPLVEDRVEIERLIESVRRFTEESRVGQPEGN